MFERVTVTMHPSIAKKIREFCEKEDLTVSAVLRKGALNLIKGYSKND